MKERETKILYLADKIEIRFIETINSMKMLSLNSVLKIWAIKVIHFEDGE